MHFWYKSCKILENFGRFLKIKNHRCLVPPHEFGQVSVVLGGLDNVEYGNSLQNIGYKIPFERDNKRIFLVDKFIKNNNNNLNGFNDIKFKQIARQCKEDGFELIIKEVDDVIESLKTIDPQQVVDNLFENANSE